MEDANERDREANPYEGIDRYFRPMVSSPLFGLNRSSYDASQIGTALIWLGLPQLLVIPLVPGLMRLVDRRIIIGIGVILFGGAHSLLRILTPILKGRSFTSPLLFARSASLSSWFLFPL
jgi:hypothetical protein